MDYATFRKVHPATRCFQRYSSETRAMMASSFRLGRRQRQAVGEYLYIHPMVPDVAFRSAKEATTAAHAAYLAKSQTLAVDAVMGERGIDVADVLGEDRAAPTSPRSCPVPAPYPQGSGLSGCGRGAAPRALWHVGAVRLAYHDTRDLQEGDMDRHAADYDRYHNPDDLNTAADCADKDDLL